MAISKIETASLDTALNAPTATALSTASGSAPSYSARAWVNFNGTGTVAIRASGNVSSITDNGTGDYTVNFTTAMPDANYSVSLMSSIASNASNGTTNQVLDSPSAPSTSSFRFNNYKVGTGVFDPVYVNVAIFR